MGAGCSKEPRVIDNDVKKRNNKMLMNLKISLKLKITDIETRKREKEKELERCQESARAFLKNGNKFEAKRQLKKKKFNEEIIQKFNTQIQVLDEQHMLLETTEINQDITDTIKKVNDKIKQVTNNIDVRELEKVIEDMNEHKEIHKQINEEINEAMNEANNDQDADLSDELEQLEAEMYKDIPKANKEKIEDNKPTVKQGNKEPDDNLVFL